MVETRTKAEAEQAVRAAGYRVSEPRSWYDADRGFGYVFSFECDRACYGAPMMEVRFRELGR